MIWFTSDTHFGHKNIIKYCPDRPGKTVEEMNEALVERWNAVVGPRDEVWHLGDVAMGVSKSALPALIQRLNGRKHLVRGNHDGSSIDFYEKCGFESVWSWAAMYPKQIGLYLQHMPHEDEFGTLAEEVPHKGLLGKIDLMLCGHVHERWAAKQLGNMKVLNVGADQWNCTPISLDEIVSLYHQLFGAINEP